MATGILKMWNAHRGFGFIRDDSGGPDMFLHIRALQSAGVDPDNLRLGEVLTFDVESGRDGRTKASNIRRQRKRIVAYHREFGMPKDPFIREKFTKLRQDVLLGGCDWSNWVRISPALAYLSRMRKVVFEPCLPTRETKVPAGPDWFHEIKHDGFPSATRAACR
jgi:cold shock protein